MSDGVLLYQLHDQARERGLDGYRRMSRAELEVALGMAEPPGPTVVETEVRDGLAVLTLRGGTGDNPLSLEVLEQLADEAERAAADEAVRVVAITGAGDRIFSAGADLAAVSGLAGDEVTNRGTAACERIAQLPVPTVALLNGHAVGGAIDLALACDWRIASQGTKLRFIHNELGYCPPWGGAQRLARLVPPGTALRLFATCELMSADEPASWGCWTVSSRSIACAAAPRRWPCGWGGRRRSRWPPPSRCFTPASRSTRTGSGSPSCGMPGVRPTATAPELRFGHEPDFRGRVRGAESGRGSRAGDGRRRPRPGL